MLSIERWRDAVIMQREAPVTMHERIEINPLIMGGKPVIRGTRAPVETVLRKLGAGLTPEAIVADHPRLTPEDIRAIRSRPLRSM